MRCCNCLAVCLAAIGAAALWAGCDSRSKEPAKEFIRPKPVMVFQPKDMTDSLAALIAAGREVYASNVVQRLAFDASIVKVEGPEAGTAMALPAHLLRRIVPNVAARGVEFHFVARSLWPIDPRNGPQTETELKGLQFLAENPGKNFYGEESLGGRRYFTAVYPDRAVVPSCAACHNAHPQSPKRDFQAGALMGGIVVRVPLEL